MRAYVVNKQDGDDYGENGGGVCDYIRLFCRTVPENISSYAAALVGRGTFEKIRG